MKICIIGTGYVGLVSGTCLADIGNDVICVDSDENKIKMLQNGEVPIYEPGLKELIDINKSEKRLSFTSDIDYAVKNSKVCFIAVGTPQREDGACDLQYVFEAARQIAKSMNDYKVIVNKSTVPAGTANKVADIIKQNTSYEFDMVSNPEFLKQGAAVDDFLSPDRVVIGVESSKAANLMQEIYSPFMRTANRIILTDIKSAEMIKYASNAFLATKISFINEIASLCEKIGADVNMVRVGMTTDKRIGKKFLFPGIGYGGSCFPKDVLSLIHTAKEYGCDCSIMEAVHNTNQKQRLNFVNKILRRYNDNIEGKTFAIWGLAFKPKTDDMREAPSVTVINELVKRGAIIKAYDPKAVQNAKKILGNKIICSQNAYDALKDASAMILMTEWNEFRYPDFDKMKELMIEPVIFDARNQYEPSRVKVKGFEYYNIGNSDVK